MMDQLQTLLGMDPALAASILVSVTAFVFLAFVALSPAQRAPNVADDKRPTQREMSSGFGRKRDQASIYEWDEEWDEVAATSDQAAMAKYLLPAAKRQRRQLSDRLMHAGLYRKNAVLEYSLMKILLLGISILLGFAASSAGLLLVHEGLIAGAAAGLLGTIGPSFWLDNRKKQRQTAMQRALPDALDVMVISVEAGLSLSAAFQKVSYELATAHRLLAEEFLIAQREIQMGCTTGEALRRLANRFDLEELRSLAAVVLQSEKFGAGIAKSLKVYAESLRIRRLQLAEARAQRAVVLLLFPTALFIFPALFVVILGPAFFDIMKAMSQF